MLNVVLWNQNSKTSGLLFGKCRGWENCLWPVEVMQARVVDGIKAREERRDITLSPGIRPASSRSPPPWSVLTDEERHQWSGVNSAIYLSRPHSGGFIHFYQLLEIRWEHAADSGVDQCPLPGQAHCGGPTGWVEQLKSVYAIDCFFNWFILLGCI